MGERKGAMLALVPRHEMLGGCCKHCRAHGREAEPVHLCQSVGTRKAFNTPALSLLLQS